MHHRPDNFARCEKLSAVRVLFTHFKKQVFVHLGQGKEMGVVDVVDTDFVNLVEDIAQIGFAIHPHPFDSSYDPPDNTLLTRCCRIGQTGPGINVEPVQMRQQFAVDKIKQLAVTFGKLLLSLPAERLSFRRSWMIRLFGKWRSPILPAKRADQCRGERPANRFSRAAIPFFLGVKDTQKENPGKLGNILQCTGAVRAAHDVADGFDE
jgi:hypothetical protein